MERGPEPVHQIVSEPTSEDEVPEPPDPGTIAGLTKLPHQRQDREAIKQKRIEGDAIKDQSKAIAKRTISASISSEHLRLLDSRSAVWEARTMNRSIRRPTTPTSRGSNRRGATAQERCGKWLGGST